MKWCGQFIFLFLLCSFTSQADIYRWVDENGATVYSDKPQDGVDAVKLPELGIYPGSSRSPASSNGPTPKQDEQDEPYSEFRILSPVNEGTVRNNAGKVTVTMQLTPKLKPGHKIVVNLDGKDIEPPGLRLSFTNIDRGSHTLNAQILDKDDNLLISANEITFHLQRFSALSPAAKARKAQSGQ